MPALSLEQSIKLLEKYKIPVARHFACKNQKQLSAGLKKIGFPIAMKIISTKIIHKTEAGGVKTGIKDEQEAVRAFEKMKKLPGFEGVIVQEMTEGIQLIIGGKLDAQFGPTILFGLGGIFVETLKDFSVRICPINRQDAKEMYSEIKGYQILKGTRGQKPINFKALEDSLLKASNLLMKEKINELDINPLFAEEKRIVAVDARVIK